MQTVDKSRPKEPPEGPIIRERSISNTLSRPAYFPLGAMKVDSTLRRQNEGKLLTLNKLSEGSQFAFDLK